MARLKIPGEHLQSVWIDPMNFKLAATFQSQATGIMATFEREGPNQVEYFPASRLDEIGARLQKAHDKILELEATVQMMRIWKKGRRHGGGVGVQK